MIRPTLDARAVAHFDRALSLLLTLNNDPAAEADKALAVDPSFTTAHVLKGLVNVLGTDCSLHGDARAALRAAEAVAGTASAAEGRHLRALRAWLTGRFPEAIALWEDILVERPNDALAMFAAHQGDFLLGASSELRDRVARRLPDIGEGTDLYGYYVGMYAFGLEETGDYAGALDAGLRAVERDRRDAWAIHAVAHVHEMTNAVDAGERWLSTRVADWNTDNFFAIHNWWHLALYQVDQQRWPDVLALYDERIRGSDSGGVFDLLDASALLWRLRLLGVDVADRWHRLAEQWEGHIDDAWYAFNDVHAAMAFAGAGRFDLAQRLVTRLMATASGGAPNAVMTRDVGLPVSEALIAHAEGDFDRAVARLLPVKSIAARAGGSNAQRDIIGLTLLSAAEKAGQHRLARALLNERLARKPDSALNRAWRVRLAASRG